MTNLISTKSIEETNTYKSLEGYQKLMVVKRENRAILESAFIHHKTTGVLLPQLSPNNAKILTEIIQKDGKEHSK